MLVLASGVVVPHVNPGTKSDHTITHFRARYVRRGATLDALLKDCWGRGLSAYEAVMIASVNGYGLCIAEPARKRVWANMDAGWAQHCAEFADITEEDKKAIEWPTPFLYVHEGK